MARILIVAPHAYCGGAGPCDRRAAEAAMEIFAHHHDVADLLLPRTARADLDLNRSAARSAPYRETIRAMVQDGTYRLAVEIHFFRPDGPLGQAVGDAQLVVLDQAPVGDTARGLYTYLRRELPDVSLVLATTTTGDLRRELREMGQPYISFEIRNDVGVRTWARLMVALNTFISNEMSWVGPVIWATRSLVTWL